MQLLRAADRVATPWKNGGGETREVVLFPEGAGWADFHWRISIATVEASGPFSLFPGIDRTLAVLDGTLRLTVDGMLQPVQGPSSSPVCFDGSAQTSGELIDRPVTDLNLMIRRGTCRGSLMPLDAAAAQGSGDQRIILATAAIDLGDIQLAPLDAVAFLPGEALPLMQAGALGWIIRISGH